MTFQTDDVVIINKTGIKATILNIAHYARIGLLFYVIEVDNENSHHLLDATQITLHN